MECCRTEKDAPHVQNNEQNKPGTITTQPGHHPGLEKPQTFQQPNLAQPPTAHANNSQKRNSLQQFPQVTRSQSPSLSTHTPDFASLIGHASSGTGTFAGTTLDGSNLSSNTTFSLQNGMQQLPKPEPAMTSMPSRLFSMESPQVQSTTLQTEDDGKISISIDFGTTFSGVAYGSSRITGGKVQQILTWPGSLEHFRKIPTCLLYDERGKVLAWGLEAKNKDPIPGTTKCEWFKLFLEPQALKDESSVDPRLPAIPPGKRPIDLIIDFLSCLWEYAKEQITRDIGAVADLNSADVWLTVPAAWDARGCDIMREAAISAGLVASSRAGDTTWRDRLRIITEPEAAAVHCAQLHDMHQLKPSQNFIVCDAGGGTVDLAVYKIIGQMANLDIAEMCARSGANCGSVFLDMRFRDLVETLLADHPAHLDHTSLTHFTKNDKLTYRGIEDDDNKFYFTCYNVEDPHDPSVGLINGELCIPGNLLRREVFDPVVNEVMNLLEEQVSRVNQPLHALLLVGGFTGSEYLKQRVQEQFGARIPVIARPPDADTATLRGAAAYGLARRPLVSSIIAPRSYIMKVKVPAEQEDWHKRPAYIRPNDRGVNICENRLQYLVAKGAILRKGQRLTTKLSKFSQNVRDSSFEATLYTSDSDKMMRYTDEGETEVLCKWKVDLFSLPTFQQNAASPNPNSFYTEFELGLELDSAEVRGILLFKNKEWGRTTFEFLT